MTKNEKPGACSRTALNIIILLLNILHKRLLYPRRLPRPLPLQLLLILLHAQNQSTLHANLVPVLVENERNRDDRNLEQAQQRAGPISPKTCVHVRSHQWQDSAQHTPDHRVTCQCRRRVHAVAVGQVIRSVDENARVAGTEGNAREQGYDPMDRSGRAGPGEPELADGNEHGTDAHKRDHCFGVYAAGFRVLWMAVDQSADEGFTGDGDEHADADAEES